MARSPYEQRRRGAEEQTNKYDKEKPNNIYS